MRLPVYKVLSKGNTEEQLQIQVTPNHEYSVKSAYRFMKKYDLDYDFEQLLSIISREKLGRDIPISENVWDNLIVINGSYSVTKDGKTMEEIKPKKAADIYRRCSPGRLRQIEEYSKQMDDSWQKPIFIHSSVFNQFSFGINKNTTLILDGARRIVAGCLRGGSFKDAHILMTSEYFGSNIIDISDIDPSALAWFPNYQTITEIGLEGKRGNKRYEYFDLSQFKDKIVFDFGCNLGQACIKIAIAGAEHVFGFESQEDTLKAANKIVDRMGIENISYHQIDFNDRDFDRKIDAIVNGDADFSCFFSVYRTKELRQRERLFQYIIDKTKDKIFFEGHADPKIDTLEYYDGLFKRFGLEYEFKGYSEGWTRPFFICAKKSLSGVAQLGTTVRASPAAEGITKRYLRGREVLTNPSGSIMRRAAAFCRRHGFWALVKAALPYLLKKWRVVPRTKEIDGHIVIADGHVIVEDFLTQWINDPQLNGLDICCGRRKVAPTAIGVDLFRGKREYPFYEINPDLVWDCLDLPFKDDTMDYIVCNHGLEHLIDPARAITEWKRILKPDGLLIVVVPDARYHDVLKLDPTHIHAFTPHILKGIIIKVGELEILQMDTLDPLGKYITPGGGTVGFEIVARKVE